MGTQYDTSLSHSIADTVSDIQRMVYNASSIELFREKLVAYPTLMAGLHATPDTPLPWSKQAIDLAVNLKTVGCRIFKIQQNLDNLDDEGSIRFLKKSILSGDVMCDVKVKDAAETMNRLISRLVGYGATWVTTWLDESGLPETEKLIKDNPRLLPYLCGVIELTTTDEEVTKTVHRCSSRSAFMVKQAVVAAQLGIKNFVCAIPEASMLRTAIVKKVPNMKVTLFCPGLREDGEPSGGQFMTGTAAQAVDAQVDYVISERAIADSPDPRYAYTGIRNRLKLKN